MKVVVCKHCNGTGQFVSKKHDWTYGSYKSCRKCLGCGSTIYVSKQQFRDIVAGRLSTRDL